jgi:hypothetical protein
MEILVVLLRAVICLVSSAAALELLAALFSTRVRRYIAQHPVAHVVWFACALLLALLLIPAHSTRQGVF